MAKVHVRRRRSAALLVALVAVAGACQAGPGARPAPPAGVAELVPRVIAQHPHDPAAFTQGLVWHRGRLYESTGEYGASSVRRVRLETGAVEQRVELPDHLFGEGLARVGDRLVQLTWREELARVYDLESFELLAEHRYAGQGWGLCFDGIELVRSDGSGTLTFHDPGSFAPLRRRAVTLAGRPVFYLNELECVDGQIYANVWQTDAIVRIDPESGAVSARVDASGLRSAGVGPDAGVLNGIAYREETATFLLTGKNWPTVFEVVLVPLTADGE